MTVHTTPTEKSLMAEIERLKERANSWETVSAGAIKEQFRLEKECERLRAALAEIATLDEDNYEGHPDTKMREIALKAILSSKQL